MKYVGSKARLVKYIVPILNKHRKENQWYVEPFVGGVNIIDKVSGNLKLGNDIHKYLIALLKKLQQGWLPPLNVTRNQYHKVKNNMNDYPDHLVGYVGFFCSYHSKWFGGYSGRVKHRNYIIGGFFNSLKQRDNLKGIIFKNKDYRELKIPKNSLIYCDPPYENTYNYGIDFDHDEFWNWCRIKKSEGHIIFISGFKALADFKEVFSINIKSILGRSKRRSTVTEKLFTL